MERKNKYVAGYESVMGLQRAEPTLAFSDDNFAFARRERQRALSRSTRIANCGKHK